MRELQKVLAVVAFSTIVCLPSLQAQMREAWVARLPASSSMFNRPAALAVDGEGNAYVTGSSGFDYLTVKYDSEGTQVWTNAYRGRFYNPNPLLTLKVDSRGQLNVVGAAAVGPSDFSTLKYDAMGNLLGIVNYPYPSTETNGFGPVGWFIDDAGNVIAAGNAGAYGQPTRGVISSYDSQGSLVWRDYYSGSGGESAYIAASAVDKDGNVFVALNSFNGTALTDVEIVKYSSTGVRQWVAIFNNPDNANDYANAIHVDSVGNTYVAAWDWRNDGRPSGASLLKFDPTGKRAWAVSRDLDVADLIADSGGNVYVTGLHGTAKYGPDGTQLWTAGGYFGQRVVLDSADRLYVMGRSPSVPNYGNDFLTVKHDTNGYRTWMGRYGGPADANDVPIAMVVDGQRNVFVTGASGDSGTSAYTTIKYVEFNAGSLPEILNPPQSQTAMAGSGVEFTVSARGTSLNYQWFFNGTRLQGETNSTLALHDLSLRDTGNYWVEVSNLDGTVASPAARLIVNVAPVIVYHPTGSSGFTQDTVYLGADARGTSPLSYHWQHDGMAIPGMTNRLLVLTNIQLMQAGGYACVVTNAFGSVTSRVAYVSVSARMAPIQSFGFAAYGTIAFKKSLGVCATASSGTARYSEDGRLLWRRDSPVGVAIAIDTADNIVVTGSSGTSKLDPDGTILWSSSAMAGVAVAVDDSQNIVLTRPATNFPGGRDFWTAKFDRTGKELWSVTYGSAYHSVPRAVAVDRLGNVLVTGDGFLTLKYTALGELVWITSDRGPFPYQASGIAVDDDGNVFVSGVYGWGGDPPSPGMCLVAKYSPAGRLVWTAAPTIANLWPTPTSIALSPSGAVYGTCEWRTTFNLSSDGVVLWRTPPGGRSIARDGEGSVYVLAGGSVLRYLETNLPPAIVRPPLAQAGIPGDTVVLSAVVSGSEPLSYRWRRDGYLIPGATNATLTFTNFQADLAGSYAVQVSNPSGSIISADAMLTVELRQLVPRALLPGIEFQVKLNGETGRQYRVEASKDLVNWSPVVDVLNLQNPTLLSLPLETNLTHGFFRLREMP